MKPGKEKSLRVSESTQVAAFYDAMAFGNDYDALWIYDEAFYDQIHRILLDNMQRLCKPGGVVLDIGCGSGAQTILLCKRGWQVHGVDISEKLLKIAEAKTRKFRNRPVLMKADAVSLPFEDEYFDCIVCFYNVLNHITHYRQAMKEMRRVLKTGGYIFLEIEKASLSDLVYGGLDILLGGILEYDVTLDEWLRQLRKPFGTYVARLTYNSMNVAYLRFSPKDIEIDFQLCNLNIVKKYGISIVSALIPWGVLQRNSTVARSISSFLRRIDHKLSNMSIFRNFGLNTLYVLKKA